MTTGHICQKTGPLKQSRPLCPVRRAIIYPLENNAGGLVLMDVKVARFKQ